MPSRSQTPPKRLPLESLAARGLVRYEAGADWFRIVASGKITADVIHPEDAFLCRLALPGLGE